MARRFTSSISSGAFTLVEVVLALAIASMLAVSVFAMITASMRSADELAREALRERREEAIQQLLRTAFLNFPAAGTILLTENSSGEMRLCLLNAPGGLGFAREGELDGGWALEAPLRSDGTRTLSLMLLPPRTSAVNLENAITEGIWIPLVPGLSDLRWQFREAQTEEWRDEWPDGAGRPELIALNLTFADGSALSESYFRVPNVTASSQGTPQTITPPGITPPPGITTPPGGLPSPPGLPSSPQLPAPPTLPAPTG